MVNTNQDKIKQTDTQIEICAANNYYLWNKIN